MGFDLHQYYEPPRLSGTFEASAFGLVVRWTRKTDAPTELPSQVAVKEVFKAVCFKMQGTVLVEEDARTLLSLRHDNVVRIFQIARTQRGLPLIVMEACTGNLNNYLELHSCSLDDLSFMGLQILEGLNYLHQKGIIHRDVKPSNILVNLIDRRDIRESGLVLKLADFGSSKRMSTSSQNATVSGSTKYMPPEILRAYMRDQDTTCYVGEKVDIFSAGVTFFRMIKGETPFTIEDRCRDDFDLAALLRQGGIESADCASLLSQMLAWNASDRSSAQQLIRHDFFTRRQSRMPVAARKSGDHGRMNGNGGAALAEFDSDSDTSDDDGSTGVRPRASRAVARHEVEVAHSSRGLLHKLFPFLKVASDAGPAERSRPAKPWKALSTYGGDNKKSPLSKYVEEKTLGTGSLGDVYLCRLKRSSDRYPHKMAVKRIRANELPTLRELDICLKLNHENIVEIFGFEEKNDLVYIKMEVAKCDLRSLKLHVKRDRFSPSEIGHLAHQIFKGLCYLHDQLIAHRDIKPSNILAMWSISPPQAHSVTLKLCDFGLSRVVPRKKNSSVTVVGTLNYMAPEVDLAMRERRAFRGDYRKADVFSAGVVFCELWLNRPPFALESNCDPEISALDSEQEYEAEATHAQSLRTALKGMLRVNSIERLDSNQARGLLSSFDLKMVEGQSKLSRESSHPKSIELSSYEIEGRKGSGSYSEVKICRLKAGAFDSKSILPTKIAVKAINMHSSNETWRSRELEISGIINHENVISFFGYEEEFPFYYIKMEFANTNLSLLKVELKKDSLTSFEVTFLANQIASGLSYLHQMTVVHRNIKPSNILAVWENEFGAWPPLFYSVVLKLSDFTLSRFSPEESCTQSVLGTERYMSPEVGLSYGKGEKFHGDYRKSDVFSVGVVVYELLFGVRPYNLSELCQTEEVRFPNDSNANESLIGVIASMLKWAPSERCDAERTKEMLSVVNSNWQKATKVEMEATLNGDGMKALHIASQDGDLERVTWLIESGDDVNKTTEFDWTPLHFASIGGHLQVVRLILSRGGRIDQTNRTQRTPLHLAASAGHTDVACLLIERGASVNMTDKSGSTPLHLACAFGFLNIVELLLSKGARKDLRDDGGQTPLDVVRKPSKADLKELFGKF